MNAHQNDGQEKEPFERLNFCATTTKHPTNSATIRDAEKAFITMQARFALLGHSLYRTTASNGAIVFLVTKWGAVRELKNLEAVAAFFAIVGGKV